MHGPGRFIRVGLLASLMAPIGVPTNSLFAQSDAWVLGNKFADMLNAPATIPLLGLPTQPGPGDYNGQAALRSQTIRTDGNGNLLFFAVDGRIYDCDGFLIADNVNTAACSECVEPGVMEMVTVPVPGQCNLFFILSTNGSEIIPGLDPNTPSRTHVSILDLNLTRVEHHPGRMGRLLDLDPNNADLEVEHPELQDWAVGLETAGNASRIHVRWLPGNSFGKAFAPLLRVLDPTGAGDRFFLFQIYTDRIYHYTIDATGIHLIPLPVGGIQLFEVVGDPFTYKSLLRDADVIVGPAGEVLLAMTDNNLYDRYSSPPPYSDIYQLLVLRFNVTTGAFIGLNGYKLDGTGGSPDFFDELQPPSPIWPPLTVPGIRGCAFSNGGSKLLITGESDVSSTWVPTIGMLDLTTSNWTDLVAQFNISSPLEMVRNRIYRNRYPGTSNSAVFLTRESSVAAFKGVENVAMMTFESNVPATASFAVPQYTLNGSTVISFETTPRFLAAMIRNDRYAEQLAITTEPVCCLFRETLCARRGYIHANANGTTWVGSNNYFGGSGTLQFTEDVVIPTGTNLTVYNMTWKFAPTAKLIVERGASLTFHNSTLTSFSCPTLRWPGVRVEGTTTNPTQTVATGQGKLWLGAGCLVENAVTGVWCAKESTPVSGDPAFYGGIAKLYSTTFRNCITGFRLEHYQRLLSGVEAPNLSSIYGCTFETTSSWPDLSTPNIHVFLNGIAGLRVQLCEFSNPAFANFPVNQRGWGIFAFDASFICKGFDASDAFRYLHAGIVAGVPNPLKNYVVDRMNFDNNQFGVLDLGSTDPVIINNGFVTLADGLPAGQISIGLYLYQSERYTVERNLFTDQGDEVPSIGIWFGGPTMEENQIYDNTFTDLHIGCVVQGRHRTTNPVLKSGLQMLCGDHSGELVDQFILGDGVIKEQQGQALSADLAANNRYFDTPDCNNTFEPFVLAFGPSTWETRYFYIDVNSGLAPELRPECVEDLNGISIVNSTGTVYDLVAFPTTDPFIKAQRCNQGELDFLNGGVSLTGGSGQYRLKRAELRSAISAYQGEIDKAETEDLVSYMKIEPSPASYLVRDLLLVHHPLSDSVMLEMITHVDYLDPWHVTQILIDNSPLSQDIWSKVEDPSNLPPYLYDILKQYDTGISTKQLLENEIAMRSQEKTRLQHQLLWAMSVDSLVPDKYDSLVSLFDEETENQAIRELYWLHILNGNYSAAVDLEPALSSMEITGKLDQLGNMLMNANGNWEDLTSNNRSELMSYALAGDPSIGAISWASMLALGELDSLPTPELPTVEKSNSRAQRERFSLPVTHPIVAAFPNPANDRVQLTYAEGMEHGTIEVFDAQGRLMTTLNLNGQKAFKEVVVQNFPAGLYLVRLIRDGYVLGETKFNVAR